MRGFSGFLRVAGCILVALLALATSPARQASAESRPDRQFGDWHTIIITGKSAIFGMYRQDSNDANVQLQMGKYQGNCNNTKVYVSVEFGQPASRDLSRDKIDGEVRVDKFPVHKTTSRLRYKQGDKGAAYDVFNFENPSSLLQEMASGQVIRFKFNLDGQEYYYRFTLNGFRPAYERIAQLCAQGDRGGERAPRQGGSSKPKPPKSDSDFFDDPAPSGDKAPKTGNGNKSDKDFF